MIALKSEFASENEKCCCGCPRWKHHPDYGWCMRCTSRSCLTFHKTGEGHGRAFEIFVVLSVMAVLVAGIFVWNYFHPPAIVIPKYFVPIFTHHAN